MESGSERCKTACIRLWRALEGCVAGKRQRSPQARLGSMSKHARAESGSRVAPSSTSYRKFGIWAAALLAVSRFLPRLRSQNCSFFSGHQLVRADMLGGRQVICAQVSPVNSSLTLVAVLEAKLGAVKIARRGQVDGGGRRQE